MYTLMNSFTLKILLFMFIGVIFFNFSGNLGGSEVQFEYNILVKNLRSPFIT